MSRWLLTAAAVMLAFLGLLASFAPDVVLRWAGVLLSPGNLLVTQVAGALYLGFAILNWMTREHAIGGIYGRPLVLANLLHFVSGGLAILKLLASNPELRALWPLGVAYTVFGIGFGALLFMAPARRLL